MLGARRCDALARSALGPRVGTARALGVASAAPPSTDLRRPLQPQRRGEAAGGSLGASRCGLGLCRRFVRTAASAASSVTSSSSDWASASAASPPAPSRELLAALRAVRLASRATESVARRLAAGGGAGSRSKDDGSPVTVADLAAQALVAWSLWRDLGARPRLVAEESADRLRAQEGRGLARQVFEEVRAAVEAEERAQETGGDGRRDAAPPAVGAAAPPPPTSVSAVLDLIDVGSADADFAGRASASASADALSSDSSTAPPPALADAPSPASPSPLPLSSPSSRAAGVSPPPSPWWLLDPVDGTRGFLAGRAYAIALSLIDPVSGNALLGVLGCPTLAVVRGEGGEGLAGGAGVGAAEGAPSARAAAPAAARAPGLDVCALSPLERAELATGGALAFAETGRGAWAAELWGSRSRATEVRVHSCAGSPPPFLLEGAVRLRASGLSSRLTTSAEARHGDAPLAERAAALAGLGAPSLRLDSQAKYALVAAGSAVAYCRLPRLEGGHVEKTWDHAAGEVIVREAGGRVVDGAGRALDFSEGAALAVRAGGTATAAAGGGDAQGPIRAIVAAPEKELKALLAALRQVAPDRAA